MLHKFLELSKEVDSKEVFQEYLLGNCMTSHSPGQKLDNTKVFKKVWKPSNITKTT